jgi:hypothetical protein
MSSFWRVHAETVGLAAFAEGISLFSFPLPSSPATTLAHELDEEAMPFCDGGVFAGSEFIYIYIFIYLFYRNFAKIYGPSQILQKYTSVAMGHGVKDITLWPTAARVTRSGP